MENFLLLGPSVSASWPHSCYSLDLGSVWHIAHHQVAPCPAMSCVWYHAHCPPAAEASTHLLLQVAMQMGAGVPFAPPTAQNSTNYFNLPPNDLRPHTQRAYAAADPQQAGTHFPAPGEAQKRSMPAGSSDDAAAKRARHDVPPSQPGMSSMNLCLAATHYASAHWQCLVGLCPIEPHRDALGAWT